MNYTERVNRLFLRGGRVVEEWDSSTVRTFLIEMPIDRWVTEPHGETEFKYVWIQNYLTNDTLNIGGYRNGHSEEVKMKTKEEHDAREQIVIQAMVEGAPF